MGILSQSSILTKHGDKMIFKITILSPFKNIAMRILSPSKIFAKSPFEKYDNGDLVSIINIY